MFYAAEDSGRFGELSFRRTSPLPGSSKDYCRGLYNECCVSVIKLAGKATAVIKTLCPLESRGWPDGSEQEGRPR